MRKRVILVSFLVIFSFFLFSCVAYAQEKTLRIESDEWIINKFPVREAAERFQKDHPDVKVTVAPKEYKEFVKSYLLMWQNNETTVDLGIGGMPEQLAPLVGADLLVDLADVVTGIEGIMPAFLDTAVFKKGEERYYPVIPFMGELMTLNINKALYADAGLIDADGQPVEAEDWDQFESQLQKLKTVAPGAALSVDWGWNFIFYSYVGGIQAMRGSIYSLTNPQWLDFESEAALKWLELNQKWIREGLAASGTITDVNYGRNNFNAGIIPAIYTAHSRFIEAGEYLGEENTSMVSLPGARKNGSIVYTHAVYVPKVSPAQELAKQFIKEQMFSKWFQQWGFNHYGKLPVVADFYNEGLTWYQKEAELILETVNHSVALPKYKGNEMLLDLLQEELHPLLLDKQTPEETLSNIRNEIEARSIDMTRLD